jgi:hypothetical protein
MEAGLVSIDSYDFGAEYNDFLETELTRPAVASRQDKRAASRMIRSDCTVLAPNSWDDVPIVLSSGSGWVEAPENGWGTLAAWSAGSANCRRQLRDYTSRTVRVTWELPGGGEQHHTEPLTAEDIEGIHEDIESYLADAGVPLPPRGFVWFIRLPSSVGSSDEFWRTFDGGVYERVPNAVHPRQFSTAMAEVMERLYSAR